MERDDKQNCALIGWIRFYALIFILLISQGGATAFSCVHEQTPGLSAIHPRSRTISRDKPSRTADSQGNVLTAPERRETSAFLGEEITHVSCFPPVKHLQVPQGTVRVAQEDTEAPPGLLR
ncbi:unnamed protein product [Pleuronectes platessa]|uniref:Uncharacterized protein n=1 Tax=Pleuronectes platessa TaxID=8262 RepID=A0A9N7Z9J5_PLEPL|nr:unnamed protein product [Pleuronectes platessa]